MSNPKKFVPAIFLFLLALSFAVPAYAQSVDSQELFSSTISQLFSPTGLQIFGGGQRDAVAPTVSISAMPINPTVGQTIIFTVSASDNTRVRLIQIFVDNSAKKNCFPNASNGSCVFTTGKLSAGTHTYYATALDSRGNRAREPKTGTKSFEVSKPTSKTTGTSGTNVPAGTSSGKGAGGATTQGDDKVEIKFSDDNPIDPYGQRRYYVDPSGSGMNLNISCDTPGGYIDVSIYNQKNEDMFYQNRIPAGWSASAYLLNWDGKKFNHQTNSRENIPAGEYTLKVYCLGTPKSIWAPKPEDTQYRTIYVDVLGQKASELSVVPGQYRKEIQQFGNFDIKNVNKIYFWGKPGGALCAAGIKIKAYDGAGNLLVELNSKKVRAHEYSGTEFAVNDLTIRKVVGSTNKEDYLGCSDIDEFGVVLFINTPTGGGTGGGSTQTNTLIVSRSGGSGKITSSLAGIDCGGTCSAQFEKGKSVTLTAAADSGYEFSSWSGCTSSTNTCIVSIDSDKTVTAYFKISSTNECTSKGGSCRPIDSCIAAGGKATGASCAPYQAVCCEIPLPSKYDLIINIDGPGKVVFTDSGVVCAEKRCTFGGGRGVTFRLEARPNSDSTFSGWGGDCSGSICSVAMTANRQVNAVFKQKPPTTETFPLTISTTGRGRIYSIPAGLDCTATCTASFAKGSSVQLNAVPDVGNNLESWSGDCSGNSLSCKLAMDKQKSATVKFVGGSGGGTGPDITKPTISHTFTPVSPSVGAAVTFTVIASDNVKVSKIDLYIDNTIVNTCTIGVATGSCTITTFKYSTAGAHNFYALAYDPSNNAGSTGVQSFTVASGSGGTADTVKPTGTVTITPTRPSTDSETKINVVASDNKGLLAIYIIVDGAVKKKCTVSGTLSACAYSETYEVTGTHTYYVLVDDAAGNRYNSGLKSFTVGSGIQ